VRRLPLLLLLALVALAATGCGNGGSSSSTAALRSTHTVSTQARGTRETTARVLRPLSLPPVLPTRSVPLPVLMYHRIDRANPTLPAITQGLTVTPANFAAQMHYLSSHGYHTVTQEQVFEALERGRPLPARPVLITFDDGYRDVWGKASPVIARLHLRATAYVITSRISGPDPNFLQWGMLPLMERRGIEIGSHTVHHLDLTREPDAVVSSELVDSRATLQRHLGHPVQWFAYPFGGVDAHVAAMVRAAGYVLAVTTSGGIDQRAAQPLELHRDEVLNTTTVPEFAALLGGR
jgi:peptidoglycan/xylan/chitin deacetylase (PgdA/CDA1 family)